MNTGIWDPNANASTNADTGDYQLDVEFLKKVIGKLALDNEQNIKGLLSENEIKNHRGIMFLPKDTWFHSLKNFSDEELITLIHFFTLAEVHFSNWQAEDKSPVIWIAKLLRKRKYTISKDLLIWIKNNNKNKFLPFGAL